WLPEPESRPPYSGRFALADPSPYESHAPRVGRPGRCAPVSHIVAAGSWLIGSVTIDRMRVMSSATLAVCGRSSEKSIPTRPAFWKVNGHPTSGELPWARGITVVI